MSTELIYTTLSSLEIKHHKARECLQATWENTIILFVCPPKFCVGIAFVSLGNIRSSKRNWKKCLCKIWGDKQRVLWYFPMWPINLKQVIIFRILLEVLQLYLSSNTTRSDKLLVLLLKSRLYHPKAAQHLDYVKNVGAIWKRRTEYCCQN